MKFLLFAASLRKESLNKKLIHLAADIVKQSSHEIDVADFEAFHLPLYNADIQNAEGFPATMTEFIERMQKADGLIISVPEYNFSIPGTLKNLIDWVSRKTPMPWQNQRILLLSASPATVGGNRGLWATRVPLEACGSLVYPEMFSLAAAHEAFDESGQLKDKALQQRLNDNIKNFLLLVEKLIRKP